MGRVLSAGEVPILMYHSISGGSGPACIAPETYRAQMAVLRDQGCRVIPLDSIIEWIEGRCDIPDRAVAITFDDGYEDFATAAFPVLQERGWPATVYLPAGKMGSSCDWERPGASGARRLMSWETVAELAEAGIEFGAHGNSHRDLTRLPPETAREEIEGSRRIIEERAGCAVRTFAAPFGRTTRQLREEIRLSYRAALGTRLAAADRTSDLYDLPRIEMWYFRDLRRWRRYLSGKARTYVTLKRAARGIRNLLPALGDILRP